ncbi:AlkZ-related protein [Paenibacillus sp. EC2-1]|uniref:AlkZ-related protein n=1 Tax=Paenibacillus sp. EC2-1 TaxID=3388665 RepID=UPI003BEEB203
MEVLNYREFVELVENYKILPFSGFVPEYPSLTDVTADDHWHTGTDTDPWQWRVMIVQDDVAAYGKFFGDKACFIHKDLFPLFKTIVTLNKTVEERYSDGHISRTAFHLYKVLMEHGNMDSRNLRKEAGLNAKEDKKEYEKSLVELQNNGDVVITGAAKQSENDAGWSSMCYQTSELWLNSVKGTQDYVSIEDAKKLMLAELSITCTDKSLKFFTRKLKL